MPIDPDRLRRNLEFIEQEEELREMAPERRREMGLDEEDENDMDSPGLCSFRLAPTNGSKNCANPVDRPEPSPDSKNVASAGREASARFSLPGSETAAPAPREPTRAEYDAARRHRKPRRPRFRPIPRRRGRIYRTPEPMRDEARADGMLRFLDLHALLFIHYRITSDYTLNPRTRAVSERELATKMRCSERTVRRLVAWGVRRGWLIAVGKSFDRRRGRKGVNVYIVLFSKTPDAA